jgi:hypothetical protein
MLNDEGTSWVHEDVVDDDEERHRTTLDHVLCHVELKFR